MAPNTNTRTKKSSKGTLLWFVALLMIGGAGYGFYYYGQLPEFSRNSLLVGSGGSDNSSFVDVGVPPNQEVKEILEAVEVLRTLQLPQTDFFDDVRFVALRETRVVIPFIEPQSVRRLDLRSPQ